MKGKVITLSQKNKKSNIATKAVLQEAQVCWSGVSARAENANSKWLLEKKSKGQNQELEKTAGLTYANTKQPKAPDGLNLTPVWMQQNTQQFYRPVFN